MKWIAKGLGIFLGIVLIVGLMAAIFEGSAFLLAKKLPVELLLQLPGWVKERLSDETFDRPGYRIPHRNEAVDHRELGMMLAPNLNVTLSTQEFSYRVVTDAKGFPNENPEAWSNPQWILTGDSNAVAAAVDPDKGWPQVSARMAGKRMLNLANNGWSLFQFAQIFDREAATFRPEWVVIAFSQTILSQNGYEYQKISESHPELLGMLSYQRSKQKVSGLSWNDFLPFTSATVAFAREKRTAKQSAEIRFELNGKEISYPLGKLRFYDRQNKIGDVMDWKGGFHEEVFRRDLKKIQSYATQRHAKLAMMYMPRKEEVYLPLLPEADPKNPMAAQRREEIISGKYDFERFRNFLKPYIEELGAVWIDPTPALQASARKGESLYWAYDTHANVLGNQRVAEFLVESLSR